MFDVQSSTFRSISRFRSLFTRVSSSSRLPINRSPFGFGTASLACQGRELEERGRFVGSPQRGERIPAGGTRPRVSISQLPIPAPTGRAERLGLAFGVGSVSRAPLGRAEFENAAINPGASAPGWNPIAPLGRQQSANLPVLRNGVRFWPVKRHPPLWMRLLAAPTGSWAVCRSEKNKKLSMNCASPVLALAGALVLLPLLGSAADSPPPAPPLPPLTTKKSNPRLPGKFVLADLVTDDVAGAKKFYGELFNWTFRDLGGYVVVENEERPLAGIFHRPRPADRPQAKPRWFGYLSVSSVDRARRAALESGGRVIAEARDLPRRGEQAIFADPEGALFGVIKSATGDPPDFLAEPGDWIWIQLLSRNAQKAAEFYKKVGGYDILENSAEQRLNDYILNSKGFARATIRTMPAGKAQPSWLPYVRVTSVRESLARARQLGGKVLIEPKSEILQGRVAVIADPAGAAVGLLEWSDDLMKGGAQ